MAHASSINARVWGQNHGDEHGRHWQCDLRGPFSAMITFGRGKKKYVEVVPSRL
jgi:hypothetical protein